MANYISKDDYQDEIRTYNLDQIIEDDDTILDKAETSAIDLVRQFLFQHYDASKIFSKTGANRDQIVVDWCTQIALYKIFKRVPDEEVPERVVKDYDDSIRMLKKLNGGDMGFDLPRLEVETGKKKTKFRGGSQKPRSH